MRLQTECISFENHWTISSSYDFQVHQQHSQGRCFSQAALQWLNVLPGAPRWTWRPLNQSSCYGGIVVPIINTTFIELSTAAYPNISFSPRLILRLNFSFLYNENSQSKPIPQTVPSVDIYYASSSNNRSSENSSNGNKPVFRYRNTR